MAGVIVRRLQAIVRKPVALFGRQVAPNPAVADFLDFFTRDRMTVLAVAALSSYQLWTSRKYLLIDFEPNSELTFWIS